jgi:hypothetical protein
MVWHSHQKTVWVYQHYVTGTTHACYLMWRFLLTTLYQHFSFSLTRQCFLCSSPTFEPWGLCLVKQFLPCLLGVHNHHPLSNFLLEWSFANLNCSWVASALWLLKSRTRVLFHFWYVLLFLICIIVLGIYFVLIFTALTGVLGSFLGLCVTRFGRICIRMPISISVLYFFSWSMRILIDKYLFSCYTIVDVCLRCTSINVQGI